LRDVALANRFFGGRHAVLAAVKRVLRHRPPSGAPLVLLDVGTGLGDIPAAASRMAATMQHPLVTIGAELIPALAAQASAVCSHAVAADALRLPFADRSVDIVTCSQVLHHFEGDEAEALLRECTRVARVAVIVGELRRSWPAVAGLWAASFVLGFHPVSRHDGIVSILRGFTQDDLAELVTRATGCHVVASRAPGFRVVAVWSPHVAPKCT
jgi:ubiquinone/menaquinone biosynthesis C-methylase UbiE